MVNCNEGFEGECPTCGQKDYRKKDKPDYEKAFDILMEYFDCIPEDERAEVDKRLRKCGL